MDVASVGQDAAVEQGIRPATTPLKIRRLLYTSHFLSMWNSRTFEFAAFLFLATIYPQTLLPASVYALARAASAAIFSPWIGNFIDSAERLYVIRLSIGGQRLAVAVSCGLLYAFVRWESVRGNALISYVALAGLSILACVERSCAILNTISVERDWAVVIAGGDESNLQSTFSHVEFLEQRQADQVLSHQLSNATHRPVLQIAGAVTDFICRRCLDDVGNHRYGRLERRFRARGILHHCTSVPLRSKSTAMPQ